MKRHRKKFRKRIKKSSLRSVLCLLNFIETRHWSTQLWLHPTHSEGLFTKWISDSTSATRAWMRTCQYQPGELLGAAGNAARRGTWSSAPLWTPIQSLSSYLDKKTQKPTRAVCMEESRVSPTMQMDFVQELSLSKPVLWSIINPKKRKPQSTDGQC